MFYAIPEMMFPWKVKETGARASLKTHTSNNLLVSGTRLIFQEEIVLKEREIRKNP
jgi:hypothetical protein